VVWTSVTGPRLRRVEPMRSASRARSRAPHNSRASAQQRFGEFDDPLDQPQRPRAERQFRAARRPKQIGDERKTGAGDVGEPQRRTAGGNHAAMNLRRFEVGIDRHADIDEVVITLEMREKAAQVGK